MDSSRCLIAQSAGRSSDSLVLVNGDELAELMIDHGVGVSTRETFAIVQTDLLRGGVSTPADVRECSMTSNATTELGSSLSRPVARQEHTDTRDQPMNLLFVCSRNQWRSPTAEQIWRKHPGIHARSAGTSASARHRVSTQDLGWADVIFVMEDQHRARLLAQYGRILEHKPIHVLDIPDEYGYMDPALVELLESAVGAVLAQISGEP
jgi:predicted protein tyrosine phosphatase